MPILISLLLAITISAAYLFWYSQAKKSTNIPENDINSNINQALGRAQQLLEDTRTETKQFEKHIEDEFSESTTTANELFKKEISQFSSHISDAEKQYLKYLEDLKKASLQVQEQSLDTVKQQVGELFLKFEQNLSDFLAQTEQKSTQSIELEIQATRHLIDSYKTQQLKVIDENIIAMLERTLTLVLSKKLTMSDQTELIYQSLEQAKAEKFIL